MLLGDWAASLPPGDTLSPTSFFSFFLGGGRFFKAWCGSCAIPLRESSTSNSYMAREWLWLGTAWQMHNRVLFRVASDPSDWPTHVESVCVCECARMNGKATSNRNWWVLSEGVRTKWDKCFGFLPLLLSSPGLQQLFDTAAWHFFDERIEKACLECSSVVV